MGLWFPFLLLESIQNHSPGLFSAPSNVQYWVNQVRRCAAWPTDIEEKQTELETENK